MTRKDYELIAAAIKRAAESAEGWLDEATSSGAYLTVQDLAEDLAGELATTNPRFDTARFLKACGVWV